MVKQGQTRASGETTAAEVTTEESEKLEERIEIELPEQRGRKFRTPGFSRMRVEWSRDEWLVIERAQSAVEGRIMVNFKDAFQIMSEVYDLVRAPLIDEDTGEIVTDQWGYRQWKQTPSGSYEEDWSKLTRKEKNNILFAITTRMFDWEQRAADAWGEAMFAKAKWEERFAAEFDAPVAGTVEDRRSRGNVEAADDKYFAIFVNLYSRKADAIVRSLSLLGQRLKDSLD